MQGRRPNALEQMETACTRLRKGTHEIAAWEWDESSAAALAQIESPHDDLVIALVTELLPHSWDQHGIKTAPEPVRNISGIWGGLLTGQRLFVCDPDVEPTLFAAWWPWANGVKFSLRVSCAVWSEAVVRADPQAKLRTFFEL